MRQQRERRGTVQTMNKIKKFRNGLLTYRREDFLARTTSSLVVVVCYVIVDAIQRFISGIVAGRRLHRHGSTQTKIVEM